MTRKAEPPDPLIDEVRERRRRLWAEHDNDIRKVYEAIKRLQAQHPEKVKSRRKLSASAKNKGAATAAPWNH